MTALGNRVKLINGNFRHHVAESLEPASRFFAYEFGDGRKRFYIDPDHAGPYNDNSNGTFPVPPSPVVIS